MENHVKMRKLKLIVLILYIEEKVHGGGLPPNGQVQMIVRGKCKYEITVNYFRITLKLMPMGTFVVRFRKGFYASRNGYNVPRTVE